MKLEYQLHSSSSLFPNDISEVIYIKIRVGRQVGKPAGVCRPLARHNGVTMITSLLPFAAISQSSLCLSFKLNCRTIPFGTVALRESPFVEAFVNAVISPISFTSTDMPSRVYILLGIILGRKYYIPPHLYRYGIRYEGVENANRQPKNGTWTGHIERRIGGAKSGTSQAIRVQGEIPIRGGILHGI